MALCFKCIAHSKTMHNPEHTFQVKADGDEKEEAHGDEADNSDDASAQGNTARDAEFEDSSETAEERNESEEENEEEDDEEEEEEE